MNQKNDAMTSTANREIVISRVINAPRELVFKAWTDPQQVAKWWGPKGFTNTIHEMDVKPGGIWRFVMHGPDGVDYNNKIVFIEIVPPARLVYSHGGDDERESEQFHVTVSFDKQGSKTALTMRSLFPSVEKCEQIKQFAIEGGNSSLDCLEEYLATM
ncbi:SRPBCC family protein [Undibacterium arcticum]|uniref:SRPBCC family protein n=1 Tax=Undibacterium arcticum TaxID=1762892 RepID=A0ABV7EW20_9BURK